MAANGNQGQVFGCPSQRLVGSAGQPTYFYIAGQYNGFPQYLSSQTLGNIVSGPQMVPMLADLASPATAPPYMVNDAAQNPANVSSTIDVRHNGGAIVAFLDGHVAYERAADLTPALFAPAMNLAYVPPYPIFCGNLTNGFTLKCNTSDVQTLLASYKVTDLLYNSLPSGTQWSTVSAPFPVKGMPNLPGWVTGTSVTATMSGTLYSSYQGAYWGTIGAGGSVSGATQLCPIIGNQDYGSNTASCVVTLTTNAGTSAAAWMAFMMQNVDGSHTSPRTGFCDSIQVGTNAPTVFGGAVNCGGPNNCAADLYEIPLQPGASTITVTAHMNPSSTMMGIGLAFSN